MVVGLRVEFTGRQIRNRSEMDFVGLAPPKPFLLGPEDLDDEVEDASPVERIDTGTGLEVHCVRNPGAAGEP